MNTHFLKLFLIFIMFVSCSEEEEENNKTNITNNVLILKVDYSTNQFEGGKELSFNNLQTSMTLLNDFIQPSDIGKIKIKYQEINQTLFEGSIHWAGTGQIIFPQKFLNANLFEHVLTADYVTPVSGFQNIFNPENTIYDYNNIWTSVQSLVKVRQYLTSNPTATVKIFLYTPSVGIGNPNEWDWIIFMKN